MKADKKYTKICKRIRRIYAPISNLADNKEWDEIYEQVDSPVNDQVFLNVYYLLTNRYSIRYKIGRSR